MNDAMFVYAWVGDKLPLPLGIYIWIAARLTQG